MFVASESMGADGQSATDDGCELTASALDFIQNLMAHCPDVVDACELDNGCASAVQEALKSIQMPRFGTREYIQVVQCQQSAEAASIGSSLSGGAIMSVDSELSIARSTLRDCSSDRGGCIYQAGGTLYLTKVIVDQPQATEAGKGLYVSGCTDWKLKDLQFLPVFEQLQTVHTVGSALSGCDDVGLFPCPAGSECLYEHYSITCHACQAGKVSTAGKTCTSCPRGSGANGLQTGCEACTGGKSSESSTCEDCPAGKFPRSGNDLCVACAQNTYSLGGWPSCDVCPAGQEADAALSGCAPCADGKQGSDGICEACPSGQTPNAEQSACDPCAPGETDLEDATLPAGKACVACAAGTVPPSNQVEFHMATFSSVFGAFSLFRGLHD